MVRRMMRKVLVLILAALGVQYLRMIGRVIVRELRPQSGPDLEQAAARAHIARQTALSRRRPDPQRLVTLEAHGAL